MPVNSELNFFCNCGFIALRISCPFSFRKRFVASAGKIQEETEKFFHYKNSVTDTLQSLLVGEILNLRG